MEKEKQGKRKKKKITKKGGETKPSQNIIYEPRFRQAQIVVARTERFGRLFIEKDIGAPLIPTSFNSPTPNPRIP